MKGVIYDDVGIWMELALYAHDDVQLASLACIDRCSHLGSSLLVEQEECPHDLTISNGDITSAICKRRD